MTSDGRIARSGRALVASVGDEGPTLVEVTIDPPEPGEIRVRIVASGICGSDLHVLHGTSPVAVHPTVLGHEGAGVVDAIGEGVHSVQVGDHVVLALYGPCLGCQACLTGDLTRCHGKARIAAIGGLMADGTSRVRAGSTRLFPFVGLGTMADYVVVRETQAVAIPADIPLDIACVAGCGVTTGLGAVFNTARVVPGDVVLVIGAGGVGLSVVQGARIAGASRIIAAEPDPGRRALAQQLGATATIDTSQEPLAEALLRLEPGGVDVAFEVVGDPKLVQAAIALTRPGGLTVMVGSPPSGSTIEVDARTLFQGRRLAGCVGGDNVPQRDIPRIIALYRDGRLRLDELVSARFPLEEHATAIAQMESKALARAVLLTGAH